MHCFECDVHAACEARTCEVCGKPLERDPDRYFKAAMEAMAAGNPDRAIRLLRDCIELNPDHLSGRYNLGLALALADRYDEANQHYMAIIKQDPKYPGIYTALGQTAFGSYIVHMEKTESKRKAMIQFLMKAIEQDPEDVDAYFSLGNAYVAMENGEQALPWLECALKLHPDSSAIYFVMAKALKMLQKHSEASVMARKSMELSDPSDPFREDIRDLLSELRQAVLPL